MDSGRGRPSTGDTGASDGHDPLATMLSRFARELQQQDTPAATLQTIVQNAVALIPGCDEGSISVVLGRQRVHSEAASGELPRIVDELQERVGQGPCLDAAYEHTTVRVPDMATETRWPKFTAEALEAGAAGMMSLQLFVHGDDLGALNLFSRQAGSFDDDSEHIGLLFAAHAALAFSAVQEQFRGAHNVVIRQLIGQAQGILMERHKITDDQAFALLIKASQHTNTKLRDVADQLVVSGQLASA